MDLIEQIGLEHSEDTQGPRAEARSATGSEALVLCLSASDAHPELHIYKSNLGLDGNVTQYLPPVIILSLSNLQ